MTVDDHANEVTAVEKQPNQPRYNIYLNGEYRLSVHEDILVRHRLMKGDKVNDRRLADLLKDEELQKAMHAALQYVGRKARSVYEVKQKLSSLSYEAALVDSVIKTLQQQGVLNDEEYAVRLTEYRFNSQKKGKNWIEQELKQKGIASEYIQKAIRSIAKEEELEQALLLAEKKWSNVKGKLPDKKRKTLSFLLRRGISQEPALQAVQRVSANEEEHGGEDDFYNT